MIDIKTEGILNNRKHGNMDIIDFVKLIYEDKLVEDYMRRFSTLVDPCPPDKLLRGRSMTCFMCMDCIRYAASRVKEYKLHYTAGSEKILKADLDNLDIEKGE